MRSRFALTLLLIPALAGAQQAAVRNERPLWTAATQWSLTTKPILEIGTLEGAPEHEFGLISGVLRMPDGGVVVADMQANEVRFFDRNGKFIRSVGRRGRGPGEWTQLGRLGWYRGDTIFTGNFISSIYELYTTGGAYVRRLQLQGGATEVALGFRSDGSAIAATAAVRPPGRTVEKIDSIEYVVYSPIGIRTGTLGRKPFIQRTANSADGRLEFGATGPSAVHGDNFYHNFTNDYAIDVYDRNGKLVRTIGRKWRPIAVTRQDIDRYRQGYIHRPNPDGSPSSPETQQDRQRSFEQLSFARQFPAHGSMKVDQVGNLWVQQFRRPTGTMRASRFFDLENHPIDWDVFSPQGRWLGVVTTPAKFFVMEIGADYIAGTARDDFDVPRALVFALQKPGCRTPECR